MDVLESSASSPEDADFPRVDSLHEALDNIQQFGEQEDARAADDSDDCSLFVGDIARSLNEDHVRSIFAPFGEVVSVDIKRDKLTKASLGYAFVQFHSRLEAALAKRTLHKTVIANRAIRIGWAQKNTNLFIGDLDPNVTTAQLRDAFRVFGEIVEEETFVKKHNYGFVRFRRRLDAETAKREMDSHVLGTRRIRIGWGDANTQKYCVFLQFDPSEADALTEPDIYECFSAFGSVVSIHLPRGTSNRLKGFGFIRYNDTDDGEEAASLAIAQLNNTIVNGVRITCNFGKKQNKKRTGGIRQSVATIDHRKGAEQHCTPQLLGMFPQAGWVVPHQLPDWMPYAMISPYYFNEMQAQIQSQPQLPSSMVASSPSDYPGMGVPYLSPRAMSYAPNQSLQVSPQFHSMRVGAVAIHSDSMHSSEI